MTARPRVSKFRRLSITHAAMMGGVHYLLVGNPVPFLVGLVMMIASFVVVPIRD